MPLNNLLRISSIAILMCTMLFFEDVFSDECKLKSFFDISFISLASIHEMKLISCYVLLFIPYLYSIYIKYTVFWILNIVIQFHALP
jgi:hypothetical protein